MKKLISFILALAVIVCGAVSVVFGGGSTQAAELVADKQQLSANIVNYLYEFVEHDSTTKTRVNRIAGSVGEVDAAQYISTSLAAAGLVTANNASTTSGYQKFDYYNIYTGKKEQSQNVIYNLSGKDSSKRVVICTNYDNNYLYYYEDEKTQYTADDDYTEGVNYSAAGVSLLLALANYLPANSLNFDVEFVFLGASSQDNAGADYYSKSIADRDNVLLVIDVSNISLGNYVYYYSGEFGCPQSSFYKSIFGELSLFANGLAGAAATADNDLGYTTPGYSGATATLLYSGVNVLHLFAGDYSAGIFSGLQEYAENDNNITGTSYDNIDYITQNCATTWLNNLLTAASAITTLISSENFVSQMSVVASSGTYKFFTNSQLWLLLTAITLIVLLAISFIIYHFLYKKSYTYAINNKLKGVMITIEDEDKHK